jgi:hypothetical protein
MHDHDALVMGGRERESGGRASKIAKISKISPLDFTDISRHFWTALAVSIVKDSRRLSFSEAPGQQVSVQNKQANQQQTKGPKPQPPLIILINISFHWPSKEQLSNKQPSS